MINVNLKKIVEDKRLTMTEVHKGTGISKNTLSTMANNVSKGIQFDTLDKLLEFLSINVQDLIIFTSKKEVESLIVEVIDKGVIQIFKDKSVDSIYSPSPKKNAGESETEYEYRLDKIESVMIGKETRLDVRKKYVICLKYDDFSYSFEFLVDYVAIGIKDKEKVRKSFKKYEWSENLDFDKEYSMHQNMYLFESKMVEEAGVVNVRVLDKHFSRINFTDTQREVAYNKIEKSLLNSLPEEIVVFAKDNNINYQTIEAYLP